MYDASKEADSLVGCIEQHLMQHHYDEADYDVKKALEFAYEQGRKAMLQEQAMETLALKIKQKIKEGAPFPDLQNMN